MELTLPLRQLTAFQKSLWEVFRPAKILLLDVLSALMTEVFGDFNVDVLVLGYQVCMFDCICTIAY